MIFTSSEATSNFVVGDITLVAVALRASQDQERLTPPPLPRPVKAQRPLMLRTYFTDSAGNNNSAATQFNWTYDTTGPSMAITSAEVSDGGISSNSTLSMTFTSSEATTTLCSVTSALAAARSRVLMLLLNGLYCHLYPVG